MHPKLCKKYGPTPTALLILSIRSVSDSSLIIIYSYNNFDSPRSLAHFDGDCARGILAFYGNPASLAGEFPKLKSPVSSIYGVALYINHNTVFPTAVLPLSTTMQPSSSNGLRGYSDFFASGFRAVTSSRSSRSSADPSILSAPSSSASPGSRRSLTDTTQRRLRPSSLIVHPSTPKPHEPKHNRRSSIITFSTRLFDRMASVYGDELSLRRGSRNSRIFQAADDSAPDVWITAGGPFTPSAPNGRCAKSPPQHRSIRLTNKITISSSVPQSIDPFSASPDTRSMFIDLSTDSSPAGTPKHESFLSLTASSSPRSSLLFGRRERPTSIQTMPLPSRSRRSSLQLPHRGVPLAAAPEKSDFSWIVEEEPSAIEALREDPDEWDAPAKIDWHQFHIDILTNDPTQ